MRQLRFVFLLSVALMASGYRWRCYIFCEEQTGIQNDYVEERDECREYAQNSIDTEMAKLPADQDTPKARQAKLVSLFSNCMARYGWDVPSGDKGKPPEPKMAAREEVPIYVSTVSKAAPPAVAQPAPAKQIIVPKPETCHVPAKSSSNNKTTNNKKTKKDPCKDVVKSNAKPKTAPAEKQPKAIEKPAPVPTPPPAAAPVPAPVITAPAAVPAASAPSPNAAPVTAVTSDTIPAPAPAPEPAKAGNKKDPAIDLLDKQLAPNFWGR